MRIHYVAVDGYSFGLVMLSHTCVAKHERFLIWKVHGTFVSEVSWTDLCPTMFDDSHLSRLLVEMWFSPFWLLKVQLAF